MPETEKATPETPATPTKPAATKKDEKPFVAPGERQIKEREAQPKKEKTKETK